VDPETHHLGNQDPHPFPDPHQSDKLDSEPDPHQFADDSQNEGILAYLRIFHGF
jgi:hypothetical protein